MSKTNILIAAAVAILCLGAFFLFKNGGDMKADVAPQPSPEKVAVVDTDTDEDNDARDQEEKKAVPQSTKLTDSCLKMLADEELYVKHKVKSYATIAPGNGDWYFRTETDFKNDLSFDEVSIEAFKNFTDAFARRGTTLILTLIPPKGIAVPEDAIPAELARRAEFDREASLKSFSDNLEVLRAAGIHAVGVTEFDEDAPFYLKADQHWTQMGADQAAKVVAEYVKTLPVYKDLPKQEFQTVIKGTRSYQGKYNEPIRKLCGVTLPNETDPEAVTTPAGEAQTDEAMFGDEKQPDVVLVGTSNSKRDDDSNFAGALKQYMSTDVNNAAIAGVGYDDPLLIYLNSKEYKEHPPKVLVWEIPAYYTFKGAKDIYKILPATIWGDCGDLAQSKKEISLIEGENALFDTSKGDVVPDGTYLSMTFAEPVKKKFSVGTYSGKQGSERAKFNVSKRTADRHDFLMDIRKPGVTKLVLKAPKELAGNKVTARLCQKPSL